jgi:DNA-binding transcriptional regulator GbsR (MarR family)|tara:strand:+ start:1796 stop:2284 length:489 start_codon:yes stop_codon:yes gene_type:complete
LEKRNKLIEKLGCHIEHREQMAPLAARILATLILSGHKGTTFETLVEKLCASKSTISTHLSVLQAANRITYHTKPGDRKKYFTLIPDAMIKSMNDMLKNWQVERELHLEVMDYKKSINEALPDNSEERFDLDFHADYLAFLNYNINSLQNLKEKLSKKNKNH